MLARQRVLEKPSVTESHFESNPKRGQDGKQMVCSWESWTCLTKRLLVHPRALKTRSFRRMPADQQWNPETVRMFVGVPWNPRGIVTDSCGGVRKRYITRALVQAHGATDGCAACHGDAQVHAPKCRKRFEDIFEQEKQPGQPRDVVQQAETSLPDEEIRPDEQHVPMERRHENSSPTIGDERTDQ